jgi:pimeloyl-ACP methyl ester carboxylesterase
VPNGRALRAEGASVTMSKTHRTRVSNVLVVGSGAAGLPAAIAVHAAGREVVIVGKRLRKDAHTVLAAGGINAALGTVDPEDRQGTRTLVLWGASDVIIPTRLGQEVRRLMPSARYIEIPAGHLPQYERPDLTNAAILQFLAER